MENDASNDEQEPPGFTSAPQQNDLGFPVLRNEYVGATGLVNAARANNMPNPSTMMPLSSFTFGGMQASSQSYIEGRSSTASKPMTDASRSQTSQDTKSKDELFHQRDDKKPIEFGLHSSFPDWEGNKFADYGFHSVGNPVVSNNVITPASYVDLTNNQFVIQNDNSASRSQRVEQGGEVYSGTPQMPQPVRSFVNSEIQTRLLLPTLDGEELGIKSNLRTSADRSHSPQKLDGSFLRLGIDSSTEDLSRCSISGTDIGNNNNQMIDLTRTNRSPQKLDGSFLRLGIDSSPEDLSRCSISGTDIGSNNNQIIDLTRTNTSNTQSSRSAIGPRIYSAGGSPDFQNDGDGLSLVQHHAAGRTFPSRSRVVGLPNSNSIAQAPQHEERHHSVMQTPIVGRHDAGSMDSVSTTVLQGRNHVAVRDSMPIRVTSFEDLMTPRLSGRISNSDAQRPQHDRRHHVSTPSGRFAPQIVGSQDAEFSSSVSNNYFQGYSTTSLIPGSSQVEVHDSQRSSATSDSNRRTSESSMFLPLNIGTSSSFQQHQFGKPSTSNDGGAMQVSEGGRQIPIMDVNRTSQVGSVWDGPFLKRGQLESSQATLQNQRRRTGTPSPIRDLTENCVPTGLAPDHRTAPMHYLRPQIVSSIPPQPRTSMLPPPSQLIPFPQQRWIAPPLLQQPWPAQFSVLPRPWPAQPLQLQPRLVPVLPFNAGPAVINLPQSQNAPTFLLQSGSIAPPEHWNRPHPLPQSQTVRRIQRPPLIRGPAPPRRGRPPLPRATTSRQQHPPVDYSHRRHILPDNSHRRHLLPDNTHRLHLPLNNSHRQHPPSNEELRIKWQGDPDTKPQPLGYKCFLCERDLSFTEEGPACMPTRAPPCALLPCGHTFHEYCLERITPPADAANPPCIPCATGNNG